MTILHCISVGFKPETTPEQVQKCCNGFLALPEQCIHPTSKKPYVKNGRGGKDHSPEGHQRETTHAFVFEFDNAEDRDYYCFKDPAHLDFVKNTIPLVKCLQVNDFTPGEF